MKFVWSWMTSIVSVRKHFCTMILWIHYINSAPRRYLFGCKYIVRTWNKARMKSSGLKYYMISYVDHQVKEIYRDRDVVSLVIQPIIISVCTCGWALILNSEFVWIMVYDNYMRTGQWGAFVGTKYHSVVSKRVITNISEFWDGHK